MMDSFRRSTLTLPLPAALAVAAAQVTFTAMQRSRISQAQLALSDTGTGTGATTALVKVNGTLVATLSINSAAAGKSVVQVIPGAFPGGVAIQPGDVITVDISALPGTTSPKGGAVYLELTQLDA